VAFFAALLANVFLSMRNLVALCNCDFEFPTEHP